MQTAYFLAFALALTAFFMQVVATVCISVAIGRFADRTADTLPRPQRPAWPLFVFSLAAFALSLWHSLYVDFLFAPWNYDFEVQSVEVLGVAIPLELGERVKNFVDSAFFLLLSMGMIGFVVVMLFLPARRVKAEAPIWVSRLLWLVSLALFAWAASRSWPYEIENLRALF